MEFSTLLTLGLTKEMSLLDSARTLLLPQTSILPVVVNKSVFIVCFSIFPIRSCAFDRLLTERGISFSDAVENPPQQSTTFSICSSSSLSFIDIPILFFSF